MSVGAIIATMFLVVSVILLGLEWLSRDTPPMADERPQRQKAPGRRR